MILARKINALRIRRALRYPLLDKSIKIRKKKSMDFVLYLRERNEYYRLINGKFFYRSLAPDKLGWVKFHRRQHLGIASTPPCCTAAPCFLIHKQPNYPLKRV